MNELAPMREQVYFDPRPKEHFDRFHARARAREPDWVYELVRLITSLYAYTLLRARAIGSENVPGKGAVILAPNHFSFMDHFLMGCCIRRKVRFMAKSQLFKGPMQFIYTHGGVFPVRRGARDEETFITAFKVLERDSGPRNYYRTMSEVEEQEFIRGVYSPSLQTVTLFAPVPDELRRGARSLRFRWRALVLPRGGNECKSGRGESAQHPPACGMKRHDGLLACEPAPLRSYPWSQAGGHHERVSARRSVA